jgi:membrane-bound serine protease (ClpP class)
VTHLILTLQQSPDAALLTLFAGILLLYFECNRPGSILPGCVGALLTLLALNAFTHMPLRPVALALVLAAVLLILLELIIPARNLLASAGTVTLVAALRILLQPFAPARVHTPTAIVAAVGFAASTLWLARIALRARRNKRSLTSNLPQSPARIAATNRVD